MLLLAALGVGPTLAGGGRSTAPTQPEAREQNPGDPTGYRLPFAPGIDIEVVQAWHSTYSHHGRAEYAYDFGLLDGTPVLAAASGIVSYAHSGETACGGPELLRELNYVTIDHPDGSATLYAHLSNVDVEAGDVVSAGQQIGLSGRTGFTECRPHLHFARQLQGASVTQSIPVYFDGFADRPLQLGEVVSGPRSACSTDVEADLPLGAFCGVYGPIEAGRPPLFSRVEESIDFDWGARGPGGYWLDAPAGGFTAHWSGRFEFQMAGLYTFRLAKTGAVDVAIDGVPLVDFAPDSDGASLLVARVGVTAGVHRIDVSAGSADGTGILQLAWSAVVNDRSAGHWARFLRLR
jgi:hypothetical protein